MITANVGLRIGAVFPQTESTSLGDIRAFVTGIESLGFESVFIADHVLGADPEYYGEGAAYSANVPVHEPLTLMAHLAAVTSKLVLATGVLILPQRQTALVAKQAAEVDLLSDGRLRLGVGIGWRQFEYDALGQDFSIRGRRLEEQVELLRLLWTQPVVSFAGRWDSISHGGLNPLPIQQPIPIWFGVGRGSIPTAPPENVLRRIAALADGWSPILPGLPWPRPGAHSTDRTGKGVGGELARSVVARVNDFRAELMPGRPLPLEGRVQVAGRSPDEWLLHTMSWLDLGATSIVAEVRRGGLKFPDEHLDILARFKSEMEANVRLASAGT